MTRFSRTSLIALAAAGALTLGACSTPETETSTDAAAGSETAATGGASTSNDASDGTVTVTDNYGEKTVPSPPKRVVALDNRSFELLDSWGIKPVAAARQLVPNSIPGIADDEDIIDIGNHREPNLEAIVAADPDVIISGQRFEKFDEEMQKLVPDATLLDFEPRDGEPFDREIIRQTLELGDVFGKQAEAEQAVQEFTEAVQRARNAYDPEQNGSAPLGWHRDFADARARLREWVAASGTRLDRDRPTRQTTWPGEEPAAPVEDTIITDRDADFVQYVLDEVATRREAEEAFFAGIDLDTGELR